VCCEGPTDAQAGVDEPGRGGAAAGGVRPVTGEEQAVLLRVDDDPTITFKVWFELGSQDDPPGQEGLAYLTGQLLAEGATERRSYEEILRALYPLASSYGVSVDREMTVLTGRTHRDNVDAFYELLTDAYLRPAFTEEDFQRVRTDALNYLENTLRYASDEELGKAALQSFVFEGTRYAHPTVGTVSGLKTITADDVRAFYRSHFTRNNAHVALGGGFDDAQVARFQATLDALPAGQPTRLPGPVPPVIEGRQVLLVAKPDADASISFGFPIDVRRGDRDFYALWLANSWLGEHRNSSSHLYQVIREARGLNYGDYSYIEEFPNGGRRQFPPSHVGRSRQIFEVWIRTLPNENAVFALRAALRELTRLVDEGLTAEQFELTREFLRKYILHYADTTAARLGYAVDDRFYGLQDEGHLARFRRMMDELTLDEVNAALRRHLQVERVKIAIVTGTAAAVRETLAAGKPTPIDYPTPKAAPLLAEDLEIARFPLGVAPQAIRVLEAARMFER